jgi:hypothetical protein
MDRILAVAGRKMCPYLRLQPSHGAKIKVTDVLYMHKMKCSIEYN